MVIPDNLRQEHMPMMVYAVCCAAKNGEHTEEELAKALSATNRYEDKLSLDQVKKVINFAKQADFIKVDKDSLKIVTEFSNEELSSPSDFSSALLNRLDLENSNKFLSVLKWFLWKGPEVECLDTHKAVREEMLQDSKLKQINISELYTHGFLFWVEFLGIATHSYLSMGCYNYSIENILIKYIRDNKDALRARGNMPVSEFLNFLSKNICFIPYCFANTEICYALSFAFRVLEKLDIIELEDKDDGSMTWHLTRSNTFKVGNSFTNIKVN